MNNRSRSTLFLMEQLIVILVFAICAAACVKIFVDSRLTASDSSDTRNSLLIAESAAECFKASGGDPAQTALLLGSKTTTNPDTIVIYYDRDLKLVDIGRAYYSMELAGSSQEDYPNLHFGKITVRIFEGEELLTLTAAGRSD